MTAGKFNMNLFKEIIFKPNKSKRSLFYLLSYLVFTTIAGLLIAKYMDRQSLQSVVNNLGNLGILVFWLVEILYIILTPFYNTAIHIAAGYIFGGFWGFVLNFTATTVGLMLIVVLVKKFGRPWLKNILPDHFYKNFDNLTQKIGPLFLFLIYVLPFTPDDEMTYIVAAGPVGFKRFILPILLGNIAKSAMSYIGDSGGEGLIIALNVRVIMLIVGLIVVGTQEYFIKKF
ncbi:MAG: TVP38/TMEM64 family protein [Patescibacteria group bacterium]